MGYAGEVILHIDVNSFFATCQQQDEPQFRGLPLGIVQDSGKRGVIIGTSREAKMIGIDTGALVWEAKKIYANIVVAPANFERFVHYARLLRKICQHYTDKIEIFSVDELFMEAQADAVAVAQDIKRRVKVEMGSWFTVSIGVAQNKMLAKLASSSFKPDGLMVVEPEKRLKFLDQHPLWHICGIGLKIQRRMNRLGIFTIRQLRQAPVEVLRREFGILGKVYLMWSWGEDLSPVLKTGGRDPEKSFGNQVTLPDDVKTRQEIDRLFLNLSWQVASRMRGKNMGAKTVSLWLRGGGKSIHRQLTPSKACATADDIYRMVKLIYSRLGKPNPVRFVGVSVSNLTPLAYIPLSLLTGDVKRERISEAWDKVAEKYGAFFLRPARLLGGKIKESSLNGFSKRF